METSVVFQLRKKNNTTPFKVVDELKKIKEATPYCHPNVTKMNMQLQLFHCLRSHDKLIHIPSIAPLNISESFHYMRSHQLHTANILHTRMSLFSAEEHVLL